MVADMAHLKLLSLLLVSGLGLTGSWKLAEGKESNGVFQSNIDEQQDSTHEAVNKVENEQSRFAENKRNHFQAQTFSEKVITRKEAAALFDMRSVEAPPGRRDGQSSWKAFGPGMEFKPETAGKDTGQLMGTGDTSYSCPQTPVCKTLGNTACYANCNLTSLPADIPPYVKLLQLTSNNFGRSLSAGMFSKFSQLEVLALDLNGIFELPEGVFEGLHRLLKLDLYGNALRLDQKLNESNVFQPMNATLRVLIMNRNDNETGAPGSVYPDHALSPLVQLEALYLDGLTNKTFGLGFREMTSLRNLTLVGFSDGYSDIMTLVNDTFQHLRQLRHLNISDSGLSADNVHACSLCPLSELVSLDLSNNFMLGIDAIGDMMYGQRNNHNLKYLKLQRIGTRYAPCIVVYRHTLRYFRNTSLEVIEAPDNEIEMIAEVALTHLPPTLKKINITDNRIMFGAYWRDLKTLEQLEQLDAAGHHKAYEFPRFFPSEVLHCVRRRRPITHFHEGDKETEDDFEELPFSHEASNETEMILALPPKLKYVSMSSYGLEYNINNLTVHPDNKLKWVDLSGNKLQNLIGPVKGLFNVQTLNISSSFVKNISGLFFDNFSSLEHLNLFQNLLGDCLYNDIRGETFDKLTELKYLSLSFNNLYHLHKRMLKDSRKLEVLDVSVNRLNHFDVDITHMSALHLLNFSRNGLGFLPPETRSHIRKLLHNGVPIRVDMSMNPITCECENIDFLEWIVSTNVFGRNFSQYSCWSRDTQGSRSMPQGYAEVLRELKGRCVPKVSLFLGVIGACLFVVVVIIAVFVHRFRWTLRYWYHAAKLKVSANDVSSDDRFDFDIFISYDSSDELFVVDHMQPQLTGRHGLRLLIHGEQFQAGRYITDNILMSVRRARKTLVLITRAMLASYWCIYELQMARMEAISTGRDVLVFLFLEDVPARELSVDVVDYIRSSTYISYPQNASHLPAFWDKLADDLRA